MVLKVKLKLRRKEVVDPTTYPNQFIAKADPLIQCKPGRWRCLVCGSEVDVSERIDWTWSHGELCRIFGGES